ncbi:YncE family protein [Gordonia aichiensis]|uniref:YncE family protein n=1 Tax=Gordonia aichiensis TaxID=36820 RepID=UPI003265F24A
MNSRHLLITGSRFRRLFTASAALLLLAGAAEPAPARAASIETVDWLSSPTANALTVDGKQLWVQDGDGVGELVVMDTATKKKVATVPGADRVSDIHFTPDGRYAYLIEANALVVHDAVTRVRVGAVPLDLSVRPIGLAFSPDSSRVYVVGKDGPISVHDTATRAEIAQFDAGVGGNHDIAMAPDGRRAYVAGFSGVAVVDTGSNAVIRKLDYAGGDLVDGANTPSGAVVVSPDSSTVYAAGHTLTRINAVSGAALGQARPAATASRLHISPDGSSLFADGRHGTGGLGLAWGPYTVKTVDMTVHSVSGLPDNMTLTAQRSAYGRTMSVSRDGKTGYLSGGIVSELVGSGVEMTTRPIPTTLAIIDVNGSGGGEPGNGTPGSGDDKAFKPGTKLSVVFTELAKAREYLVKGESTPFCVDERARTDDAGTLRFDCTLPSDLEPGLHNFNVYDGTSKVASIEFTVSAQGRNTATELRGSAGSTTAPGTGGAGPDKPGSLDTGSSGSSDGSGSLGGLFGR